MPRWWRPSRVVTVSGRALADGVNTATTRWRHRYPDGATIALTGFNGIPWLRTMLGMSAAGCVTATINPLGAPAEILAQLHRCRARHLVADPSVLARVNDDLDTTVSAEELRPDEPAESAAALDLPAQHPDQVQLLMTSSGTTGAPKTARLTRRALAVTVGQLTTAWELTETDVVLAVLPFSHAAGLCHALTALWAGATVVTLPRFEPAAFLSALADHRVSVTLLAPPILRLLATHPAVDGLDLRALRVITCAGAPLPAEVQTGCARRLGVPVLNAYGMTETGWTAMGTVATPNRPGTVGRPVPGVDLRLVDPTTGTDAAPGTPGELWVRGPQAMSGYLDDPDGTAALITPRAGRAPVTSARRRRRLIRIVDRLKELIKYKGYQVSPAELEALLLTHPDVRDVAVVGVPTPRPARSPRPSWCPRAC